MHSIPLLNDTPPKLSQHSSMLVGRDKEVVAPPLQFSVDL